MESICLADFVALYNYSAKGSSSYGEMLEDNENSEDQTETKLKLRTLKGFLTRRKQPKVIRFCRFDCRNDSANFFRELVMLFKPWRNEVEEVESQNCEDIYKQNEDVIEAKYREYTAVDLDFNEIIKELENRRRLEDQQLLQCVTETNDIEETMTVHDYDDNLIQANVLVDMGEEVATAASVKSFSIPEQLSNEKYFDLCDDLNVKQRDYLMHLVNVFKMNELPIYHFITGGAGVGKSRLIKSVYQSILRIYRQVPGPVETNEIIIVSHTGKAAHNVGGMTSHSAFSLYYTQNGESNDLGPEALNTLRVKLWNMKLLIIDESTVFHTSQTVPGISVN